MNRGIWLIIILGITGVVLIGCSVRTAKTNELSQNIDDYQVIVDYLLDNYKDNNHSYGLVNLSELSGINEIKNQLMEAEKEFDYVWMTNDYVVLWNDETKVLGLLYSDNINESIDDLKTWYDDMEYEKINANWCTVGTWRHQ